jgi:FAD:protein FMN transferase
VLDDSYLTMGTVARVVREADGGLDLEATFAELEHRLSRFDRTSELSLLNADPRACVPASPLLCAAVSAALRAARVSGGLVDPTLVGALRRAGYARTRACAQPGSLARGLAVAPPRRPARPDPLGRWWDVTVNRRAGEIRRPPGLELDLGGSAKGWAADLIAKRLAPDGRCAVDCGGDLRVAGGRGAPWQVRVRHPLTGEVAHTLRVRAGAVATSGIDARLWQRPDGDFAHHLIDPSTGEPAWTGLIAATALAPTALDAEALAKAALLSGPARARALLRMRYGGVLVHDDGAVEPVRAGFQFSRRLTSGSLNLGRRTFSVGAMTVAVPSITVSPR